MVTASCQSDASAVGYVLDFARHNKTLFMVLSFSVVLVTVSPHAVPRASAGWVDVAGSGFAMPFACRINSVATLSRLISSTSGQVSRLQGLTHFRFGSCFLFFVLFF